jgi:hypothetical protein
MRTLLLLRVDERAKGLSVMRVTGREEIAEAPKWVNTTGAGDAGGIHRFLVATLLGMTIVVRGGRVARVGMVRLARRGGRRSP